VLAVISISIVPYAFSEVSRPVATVTLLGFVGGYLQADLRQPVDTLAAVVLAASTVAVVAIVIAVIVVIGGVVYVVRSAGRGRTGPRGPAGPPGPPAP
jgi:hypothetical protein